MEYLLDSIEGYKVTETTSGLDVHDKDDNFICELEGYSLSDFEDDKGGIDEDELYYTIRDEEQVIEYANKLTEMYNNPY